MIPCLDEAPTIATVVGRVRDALNALDLTFEIIVADNGSADDSRRLAEAAGARVIDASSTRGYGAASIAGGRAAEGRWIVFTDADGEHDVAALGALLEPLRTHDALVLGSRALGGYAPNAGSRLNRWVGTPVLTFLLNRFIGTRVTDCNTGFRAMPKAVFDQLDLRATGMELATEVIVRAGLLDVPIIEVPVVQQPPAPGRQPHLRRFRDGWRHLQFILLHAPDRVLLMPGAMTLALGLLFFAPQIAGPARLGPLFMDIHLMILGALLMLIGVEMIGSAVVCATIAGEPVAPPGHLSRRLGRAFGFERMLIFAGLLFALGFAADVSVVVISARQGFELMEPRLALIGTTAMGIAVELAVLSFVHSVVEIHRSGRQ